MSTLQIGLAIAGGLVLAAVVAHGAWSARKVAPRQAQPGEAEDPAPHEPAGIEPSLDDAEFVAPAVPPAPPEKRPGLDALIDVIAPIALEAEVRAEVALAALPTTRRVGSKPFAVEGLNVRSRHWEGYRNTMRTGTSRYAAGDLLAVPAITKDGSPISIEFSVVLLRDSDARVVAVGAIIRDVTMRFLKLKQLRKKLAAASGSEQCNAGAP